MSNQQYSKLLKLCSKITGAINLAVLKAAFKSMQETVQQERNNLQMKTNSCNTRILMFNLLSQCCGRADCHVFMALHLLFSGIRAFTGYPNMS